MREESHHHLIFQNSYVNVFFVEIPPHESTLEHRHDLPYISVPPGELMRGPFNPAGAVANPAAPFIPYNAGHFSHSVSNPGDAVVRNIAIELVRPQGVLRNLCENVLAPIAQPVDCPSPNPTEYPQSYPLFETDEIVVESWEMKPDLTSSALDRSLDVLVAGMWGVSIHSPDGLDSAHALRGGVLWIPANSKPVLRTEPDHWGHFIAITFKDSARPAR